METKEIDSFWYSDIVVETLEKWYSHFPFGVSKGEARTEFAEILEKVRTSVRIDMREGLDLNLPYAGRSNLQSWYWRN